MIINFNWESKIYQNIYNITHTIPKRGTYHSVLVRKYTMKIYNIIIEFIFLYRNIHF